MFAEWFLSHFAHKVVGVSEHTTENLRKYEHISSNRLETIYNGIDESRYTGSTDIAGKRKELGIRPNGPVIGLGVRLCEQKGISYLLRAMPRVIESYPDISLVIAGTGPLENRLKSEARELELDPHVFFVGKRADMHEILNMLDVYVLPSLWEGLPMVLLETMAAECPIIATNVGGNPLAVQNGTSGILVPPEDENALSVEIIGLLSDEERRKKYRCNAKSMFDEKFSARMMTRQYEVLYEEAYRGKALVPSGFRFFRKNKR